MQVIEFVLWLLDMLIPRFVTEWVVIEDTPDGFFPVCAVNDLDEYEWHEGLLFCQMRSFAFLGMGFFSKQITEVVSRAEYERRTNTINGGGFS